MPGSPTSFYNIVLFNSKCNDLRLRIPQKVVEQCGSQISDPVSLMVPTGGIWKVRFEKKADQTAWLHGDGLFKFVQDNSIKLGYFLLFKYGGSDSNFSVLIFDWSAMEIQNYHPSPSLRGDSAAGSFEKDHQRNPPSFNVTMKLNHIKNCLVRIPNDFMHQHLLPPPKFIKLVDTGGNKEWKVGMLHYPKSGTYISKGWSTFVHDKELQVGDVCVFELMDHDNQNGKLRVNVVRANEK